MVDTAAAGFEAWRTRNHPDCSIKAVEQAYRVIWFALYWVVQSGRNSLAPEELEAIWNYSMLYPYIDNFLDSNDPDLKAHRKDIISDIRYCLLHEDRLPAFTYHPYRTGLIAALTGVKYAAMRLNASAREEISSALQCLMVVESTNYNTYSKEEVLFHSCMKGALALVPICFLNAGLMTSADHQRIFSFGLGLQLIDDLQDTALDSASQQSTIFTLSTRNIQDLNRGITKTLNYLASNTFITSKLYSMIHFILCRPFWKDQVKWDGIL